MEAKIKDNLRLEVYRNLDLEDYYYFIVARLQIVDQELSKIWIQIKKQMQYVMLILIFMY